MILAQMTTGRAAEKLVLEGLLGGLGYGEVLWLKKIQLLRMILNKDIFIKGLRFR